MGFKRGKSSPCTLYSSKLDARIVVHGDDFTVLAQESIIRYVAEQMAKIYKLKLRGTLGPDSWDDKELTLFNRVRIEVDVHGYRV